MRGRTTSSARYALSCSPPPTFRSTSRRWIGWPKSDGASGEFALRLEYYQAREFTAELDGQPVTVVSKPGIPHWDTVSPGSLLLAEEVRPGPGARVLVMGCGHGALAAALSPRAADVTLFDINCIALDMAGRTMGANGIGNASILTGISLLPEHDGAFDIVVIELPRGRSVARRWLLEARTALRTGGELYLAGANDEGIQSTIKDAQEIFEDVVVLRHKQRCRVARGIRPADPHQPEPGWAAEPGVKPGSWHEFEPMVGGEMYRLSSLPGIFSSDRLDEGTALLLDHLNVMPGERVVDAGCGYGIIGLVAARRGAAHVTMVDVDLRAVAAARKNSDVKNCIGPEQMGTVEVVAGDALAAVEERSSSLVATNPPFHAGREVDYQMAHAFIFDARRVLEPGGRFVLVANRFIPYQRLLQDSFPRVECLAATSKYQVLSASTK